jgi:ribulose-5-phosphate 4-epimerase/fuculose-1-phosphate aldolase
LDHNALGLNTWQEKPVKHISDEVAGRFVRACCEAAQRGLMRCSSGNLSWRVDAERMLVTATRSWASRLTADDVVLMRLADGAVLEGRDPTIEVAFHAGILRARPEVDVVMHFQTTYATMLACQDTQHTNFFVIPEIPVYLGPIGHVPFLTPGSQELADAVIEVMRDHDLAIMANHGQVTVARDLDHAIQNAEFFELACQIIVQSGADIRPLAPEAVRMLLAMRAKAFRPGV